MWLQTLVLTGAGGTGCDAECNAQERAGDESDGSKAAGCCQGQGYTKDASKPRNSSSPCSCQAPPRKPDTLVEPEDTVDENPGTQKPESLCDSKEGAVQKLGWYYVDIINPAGIDMLRLLQSASQLGSWGLMPPHGARCLIVDFNFGVLEPGIVQASGSTFGFGA